MTYQDNFAAIRAACVAANPEIAELKFGCLLRHKTYGDDYFLMKSYKNGDVICGKVTGQKEPGPFSQDKLSLFEIVGRPVTLPDVLLALGNLGGYSKCGSFYVSHLGYIERVTPYPGTVGQNKHEKVCEVDLRLPLSGQSEEAVAALANLLKRDA